MADDTKGILDQFAEFLAAKQAADKDSEFAVDLETTDKDGHHVIRGVPYSQVGADFLKRFGIGQQGGSDGGTDGGKDKTKAGGKDDAAQGGGTVSPLDYFRGKRASAG